MTSIQKKKNRRLGKCEVCKKEFAKYTCPACEIYTCSLPCLASHKKETECDGIRSRTSYIPLTKFGDLDLLSDVRFLEDAGRCVEKCMKDKTKRYSRVAQPQLPTHLFRLSQAAFHRGVRLLFLPQHFTRHKTNTTFYNWKQKVITWRVQLTFLNADMLTFHEEKCDENVLVEEIISKYINTNNSVLKSLRPYQIAGIDSIDVLMKVEKLKEPLKKFHKLDPRRSLKDNLNGKVVVEYPQLFLMVNGFYTAKTMTEIENEKTDAKNAKLNDYLQLNETVEEDTSKQEHDEKNVDMESDDSTDTDQDDGDDDDDSMLNNLLPSYKDLITP